MEFEQVYRTCFDQVFRYLCRLTGDCSLAEELTAETFFRAMKALDSFRSDCPLQVWLCGIARRTYLSHLRKNGRIHTVPEPLPAEGQDTFDVLEDQEQAMMLHRLLHSLPEPYKEVFSLRVFGELSFRQIGSLFGKSENWACVTFHRAKAKLKDGMEESL